MVDFNRLWASAPGALNEEPVPGKVEQGWDKVQPPKARWQNWFMGQVSTALQWLQRRGVMDWSSVVPYELGTIVNYSGVFYRALVANTNLQPDVNPAEWRVVPYGSGDVFSSQLVDNDTSTSTILAPTANALRLLSNAAVKTAELVTNLTTNDDNLALAASQGVALKALIDAIDTGDAIVVRTVGIGGDFDDFHDYIAFLVANPGRRHDCTILSTVDWDNFVLIGNPPVIRDCRVNIHLNGQQINVNCSTLSASFNQTFVRTQDCGWFMDGPGTFNVIHDAGRTAYIWEMADQCTGVQTFNTVDVQMDCDGDPGGAGADDVTVFAYNRFVGSGVGWAQIINCAVDTVFNEQSDMGAANIFMVPLDDATRTIYQGTSSPGNDWTVNGNGLTDG